jgi:anti-anti-sigma factor
MHFESDGDALIVAPHGDCSSLDAETLLAELQEILARISSGGVTALVVDLEQTPYFGSTMLGVLIKLWRQMTVARGRLALCNVSPAEREVLEVTHFDSVWSIFPTRAAALADLRSTETTPT